MKIAIAVVLCLAVLSGCGGGGSGDEGQAYGLSARAATSGLQIPTGVGNGAPFAAVNAVPNVKLPNATTLTHAGDGSNRLFASMRGGRIDVFNNNAGSPPATTFLDITPRVDSSTGEGGLLGLAFDPAFRTNGFFYVYYVTITGGTRKVRVSRFGRSSANVANPASERVVLELDHPNPDHFGGWLGFGPDGLLYISSGDAGVDSNAQSPTSLFGKILRIRVNTSGTGYTVPADNPSSASPVWASGFRNPWRCSFDRGGNRDLWCGDVGQASREEVNRIRKGGNYGWPVYEGSQSYTNPGNRPLTDFDRAVHEYDHTQGVAVIGGYVYRGSAHPSLVGRYLYSDYATTNLWAIETDGGGNFVSNSVVANNLDTIQTLGEDEAGEVYVASAFGGISRLQANAAGSSAAAMPATLSATGLFTDLAALTPSPALIDYELNSPLWSDGARKQRWFVLPDAQTIGFAADGAWTFPAGTITVKHFELVRAGGGLTRVETRVMVNRPDGWVGYTYRWRGDQSDADLLVNGASAGYDTVNPATGAAVRVNWTFPSQAQCLNCHTQATGRVLGLNTLQINRDHTYQSSGTSDNQLRTLNHIGMFSQNVGDAAQYGALPNPTGGGAPLESRAKAYLESNCSNCHRPGGPTPVNMDLRYTTGVADMRLVGVAAERPTVGGAVRIVAGNHAASDLWRRASSGSATRMPPLGVSLVDDAGVNVLADWIDTLR